MRFAFYTLGCKTNQYETQAMEQLLLEKGHEIGTFSETCDGYIINTCSVTAVADKKNRAIIRRCRREHPEAVIAVCGCYSQHDAQAQGLAFLFGALGQHPDGIAEIQTEQLHKAFAIDLIAGIPEGDGVGATGGKIHKGLHILHTTEPNLKFLHKCTPCNCTKIVFSCIIGENNPGSTPTPFPYGGYP